MTPCRYLALARWALAGALGLQLAALAVLLVVGAR